MCNSIIRGFFEKKTHFSLIFFHSFNSSRSSGRTFILVRSTSPAGVVTEISMILPSCIAFSEAAFRNGNTLGWFFLNSCCILASSIIFRGFIQRLLFYLFFFCVDLEFYSMHQESRFPLLLEALHNAGFPSTFCHLL